MKKKKIANYTEYRVLKRDGQYSIIQVYLNNNNEIVGYSDYIIPTSKSKIDLKYILSSMMVCTRKDTLTDEDLNKIKK